MSLAKEHLMSLLVQSKHACDGINIERILLDIKFGWYHDYKIFVPYVVIRKGRFVYSLIVTGNRIAITRRCNFFEVEEIHTPL